MPLSAIMAYGLAPPPRLAKRGYSLVRFQLHRNMMEGGGGGVSEKAVYKKKEKRSGLFSGFLLYLWQKISAQKSVSFFQFSFPWINCKCNILPPYNAAVHREGKHQQFLREYIQIYTHGQEYYWHKGMLIWLLRTGIALSMYIIMPAIAQGIYIGIYIYTHGRNTRDS